MGRKKIMPKLTFEEFDISTAEHLWKPEDQAKIDEWRKPKSKTGRQMAKPKRSIRRRKSVMHGLRSNRSAPRKTACGCGQTPRCSLTLLWMEKLQAVLLCSSAETRCQRQPKISVPCALMNRASDTKDAAFTVSSLI